MKYSGCPFCAKSNLKYIYPEISDPGNIYAFNYVYCSNCDIAYLNPFPEESDLIAHYGRYVEEAETQDVAEFKIDGVRRRIIDYLRLSKKSDRILDIGCGKGETVYCLSRDGYAIDGIDPYFIPRYDNAGLNERIHTKRIDEAGFPDDHFTVAMMWSTLEHMSEPMALLREVSRITAPGGRLVISVPNFRTFQHRLLKKQWPGFGPPEHLVAYTSRALEKLLFEQGFKLEKRFSDPIYDQWMLKNSLYRYFQETVKKGAKNKQASKDFNKIERLFVGLFSFAFVRTEALVGRCSTSNIVFVKL